MNISDPFLEHSILVIDEAHNITDTIEDNASFDLLESDIKLCAAHVRSLKDELAKNTNNKLKEVIAKLDNFTEDGLDRLINFSEQLQTFLLRSNCKTKSFKVINKDIQGIL